MQDAAHRRWGDVPLRTTHLPIWAEAIAEAATRGELVIATS